MSALAKLAVRLRAFDIEEMANLRPAYPSVAVEVDRDAVVLVRVLPQRRSKPALDAHHARALSIDAVGASILRPNLGAPDELSRGVKGLFEGTGTKPGRLSLVLPDNLARTSIVTLPERPPSRKQMAELLRFKLRRTVPFRLEDAMMTWQVLPGPGAETHLLVAVMMRSVVEQYEAAFSAVGATPGLVDLCSTSLFNLCRREMEQASTAGGTDSALLNCARGYFSLMIVRGPRVLFFRCKSTGIGGDEASGQKGSLLREIVSSMSYYREKLSGAGVGRVFVRSTSLPLAEVVEILGSVGLEDVVEVSPLPMLAPGTTLDAETARRIAPCVGATAGRMVS